jgi:hypothetical protein
MTDKFDGNEKAREDTDDDVAPSPAPERKEVGGRGGPDPSRYGDWEKNGRCIDF